MLQIAILLEKYKSLGTKERETKSKIKDFLLKELKIELDVSKITFKDGQLRISISGARKTELVLQQENIKKKLNDFLSEEFKISKIN